MGAMLKNSKEANKPAGSPIDWKRFNALAQRTQRVATRWWKTGRKMWSLQGAGLITAAAALASIIQILIAVHGKLVILPFEVRSAQNTPSELGASFSVSLSVALNEYRSLFPSSNSARQTVV